MRNMHIIFTICLLAVLVCSAHADNKGDVFGEAYFDKHDKQVVESLRKKMKQNYGEKYNSLTEKQQDEELEKYIEAYIKENRSEQLLVKIKNKPMTFFGKVVDEDGLAVEGATVTMVVDEERMVGKRFLFKQTLQHQYSAATDETGAFMIEDGVGWRIILKNIEAAGYRFDNSKQPSIYFFPISHASQLKAPYFFRSNRKFPVIFVLVKDR